MKAVAGGLVTLAGAVLWGAGALALTLAPLARSSLDSGSWAAYAGGALVLLGVGVVVTTLVPERRPPQPPEPPR